MALLNPRLSVHEPNYSGLFRLLDDFDRYSSQTSNNNNSREGLSSFTPKFDVKETETTYVLQGELPGLEKKDINIEFTDPQTVRVHGKVERSGQEADGENKKVKYWISERSAGAFSRSFQFPEPIDHDGVNATLREGILYLAVPKAKKTQGRRQIAIN